MSLRFVIINVNGFRDEWKRRIIFSRLLELNVDVVFLTETHITNKKEAKTMEKEK